VPRFEALPKKYLSNLHRIVRRVGTDGAYSLGDETILKGKLGLNDRDLDVVQQGIFQLRRWRAPNGDDPANSLEDVNE
jgi:hypothetical protein